MGADRLIVFATPNDLGARILLPAVLDAAEALPGLRCAAIVVPPHSSDTRTRLRHAADRGVRHLQYLLGSGRRDATLLSAPLPLQGLAAKHRVPLLPTSDANAPDLLDGIADGSALVCLSLYWRQRLSAPLLGRFDCALNYHNGALPRFRGLAASNWSLYCGDRTSGYSVHRMDAGFDTGPVVCAGSVPVTPDDTPADLELRKARDAADRAPQILQALLDRSPGQPQPGIGGEHTATARALATTVDHPGRLSRDEWFLRLRAFLLVRARVHGRWIGVTALSATHGPGPLSFATADGHWLRVTAIDFWPAWLSRAASLGRRPA